MTHTHTHAHIIWNQQWSGTLSFRSWKLSIYSLASEGGKGANISQDNLAKSIMDAHGPRLLGAAITELDVTSTGNAEGSIPIPSHSIVCDLKAGAMQSKHKSTLQCSGSHGSILIIHYIILYNYQTCRIIYRDLYIYIYTKLINTESNCKA